MQKQISTLVGVIIIVAVSAVLFGGVFAYQYLTKISNSQFLISNENSNVQNTDNNNNNSVACTQEVKICSDGSSVGRTGPNCEFAECPAVVDQTAGWKTYTNTKAGYSISYPNNANIIISDPTCIRIQQGAGEIFINKGFQGLDCGGTTGLGADTVRINETLEINGIEYSVRGWVEEREKSPVDGFFSFNFGNGINVIYEASMTNHTSDLATKQFDDVMISLRQILATLKFAK